MIVSLVSTVYVASAIYHFTRHRKEFDAFLGGPASTFTADRYRRLIWFSSIETLMILPLTIYEIVISVDMGPVQPWISWADTHSNYNRADRYMWILISTNPKFESTVAIALWCIPLGGVSFFFFFGLRPRQIEDYKHFATSCLRRLHIISRAETAVDPLILPTYTFKDSSGCFYSVSNCDGLLKSLLGDVLLIKRPATPSFIFTGSQSLGSSYFSSALDLRSPSSLESHMY